ncbi:hypothetical protein [Caballeronia sp. Sq4a]|uniref:hypothetical protein n=1 Tax=Caballeronia sp. Sq4a TaxID=2878152 RepID=UPI0020C11331|nr:hypothetical protein [Caballeronia sp. Sq4a]
MPNKRNNRTTREPSWVLLVKTPAGETTAERRFADARSAETAAYIAKVAYPESKVSLSRDRQFGQLVWHCGTWYNQVSVKRGGAFIKCAPDFATAVFEHEFLRKAAASGVRYFY